MIDMHSDMYLESFSHVGRKILDVCSRNWRFYKIRRGDEHGEDGGSDYRVLACLASKLG